MFKTEISKANSGKEVVQPTKSLDVACIECNEKICIIHFRDTTLPEPIRYQFKCPCGGESYLIKCEYASVIVTEPTFQVIDCQTRGYNKFIYTVKKV